MSRASWFEFTAILCENAHHHADYSSAQWALTTLVRYATRTVLAESCVSAGHQGKAFDWCQQTSQHRDGVSAAAVLCNRVWNVSLRWVCELQLNSCWQRVYGVITAVNARNLGLRLSCHCFILALLIAVVDFSQTCLLLASADALAAVGVNCSSSSSASSSKLSACWLGCSASVWAPTAWLTARRNCSLWYAPLSNRDTQAVSYPLA